MSRLCRTCAKEPTESGVVLKLFERKHRKLLIQLQDITGILVRIVLLVQCYNWFKTQLFFIVKKLRASEADMFILSPVIERSPYVSGKCFKGAGIIRRKSHNSKL